MLLESIPTKNVDAFWGHGVEISNKNLTLSVFFQISIEQSGIYTQGYPGERALFRIKALL